jgi:hypothetical protein
MCSDFVAGSPSARGPDPEPLIYREIVSLGCPRALPDPREKSLVYLFGGRFFALLSDGSEERLPFFAGVNQVISSDSQRILPLRLTSLRSEFARSPPFWARLGATCDAFGAADP